MRSKFCFTYFFGLLWVAACAFAQPAASSGELTISEKEPLPKASLWIPYSYRLNASGGSSPYLWRVLSGALPRGIRLGDIGELSGMTDENGSFDFTVLLTDNSPTHQAKRTFTLSVETPLSAEWRQKAAVNGQRIDGSIKVSNRTGRDFDLTVIVLAVKDDTNRATAIGYQHFVLNQNTRDFDIPFGESLSRGNYTVSVDVVGEEPISQRIFRTRLVTDKQQITQGP